MSYNSKIEWTDATWNPVAGCSLASSGCTNCYAMQMARRLEAMGVKKYIGLTTKHGRNVTWNGRIREDSSALGTPHNWKKPRKIFVNSMSDLFHEDVSKQFISSVWEVMRETPQHNYQILTKRPERMLELATSKVLEVLPNVWLGTSVENSKVVHRIDFLRHTPASIRFISFEPLIGAVGRVSLSQIDWVIVGGESGPNRRPMNPEWVRDLRNHCVRSCIPFFFKQWGGKRDGNVLDGTVWEQMPQ